MGLDCNWNPPLFGGTLRNRFYRTRMDDWNCPILSPGSSGTGAGWWRCWMWPGGGHWGHWVLQDGRCEWNFHDSMCWMNIGSSPKWNFPNSPPKSIYDVYDSLGVLRWKLLVSHAMLDGMIVWCFWMHPIPIGNTPPIFEDPKVNRSNAKPKCRTAYLRLGEGMIFGRMMIQKLKMIKQKWWNSIMCNHIRSLQALQVVCSVSCWWTHHWVGLRHLCFPSR